MTRLFVAVAIPADVGAGLAPHQKGLPGVRWRPSESLHITLHFVGNVAKTLVNDLGAELSVIRGRPFDVTLAGAGSFGDGSDIRAVGAGVEESEPLRRLAARCKTAARRAGLKADTIAWRPHVTLAYVWRAEPAHVAAWIAANDLLRSPLFAVTAFGLYSSRRTDAGSAYRRERDYPLT